MEKYSPMTRMMLATETIKDEQSKKSSSSPLRLPNVHGGPYQPVLFGTKAVEAVKEQAKISAQIPLKTMYSIIIESDCSKNSLLATASKIQKDLGRNAIESGLKQALIDYPKIMRGFFGVKTLKMFVRNKVEVIIISPFINDPQPSDFYPYCFLSRVFKRCELEETDGLKSLKCSSLENFDILNAWSNNLINIQEKKLVPVNRQVPYCKDLAALTAFVLRERNVTDHDLKIGADVGDSSLKVNVNFLSKKRKRIDSPSTEASPAKKLKETKKESKYKDSGVKKTMLIAIRDYS